jgi:hypothetical protein
LKDTRSKPSISYPDFFLIFSILGDGEIIQLGVECIYSSIVCAEGVTAVENALSAAVEFIFLEFASICKFSFLPVYTH